MPSMTFKYRDVSKASNHFGACDSTIVEVVHDSGRIEGHETGIFDGKPVDRKYTLEKGPLNLEVVKAARIRTGWAFVKEIES